MKRRLQLILGRWMWEDWHLYRWTYHESAVNPNINWWDWDQVL